MALNHLQAGNENKFYAGNQKWDRFTHPSWVSLNFIPTAVYGTVWWSLRVWNSSNWPGAHPENSEKGDRDIYCNFYFVALLVVLVKLFSARSVILNFQLFGKRLYWFCIIKEPGIPPWKILNPESAVTMIWVSSCFGYPRTQNTTVGIPKTLNQQNFCSKTIYFLTKLCLNKLKLS